MKDAIPSFFGLFRRSRYIRPSRPLDSEDDNSEESKEERREVERFAVACIGFCLRHDEPFRKLFWQKVLGGSDGTNFPEGAQIEVEPEDWADLRIEWSREGKNYVHVIECKVGAPLEDKQNPSKPEFQKKGGYGQFFLEYADKPERNAELSYTLLGVRETIVLSATSRESRIQLRAPVPWTVLAHSPVVSVLHDDLVQSLSKLEITAFSMINAQKVKIELGAGFASILDAQSVLKAVIYRLKLVPKYCKLEIGGGDAIYCAWIKQVPPKTCNACFHESLGQHLGLGRGGHEQGDALWFGYVQNGGSITREVGFNSGSEKEAATILNRIKTKIEVKKKFPIYLTEPKCESGVWAFYVRDKGGSDIGDVHWFTSIIFDAFDK